MEPNEWLDFRLRWLTTCQKYKARNGCDEGMKSTLLELLLEGQELNVLWEELKKLSFQFFEYYSGHFLKTHNAEVVERYCKYVLHYMEKSQQRDRGTYKRMADYLRRIKKMGGIEQANLVRDTLLNTYNRSPALADELRAV